VTSSPPKDDRDLDLPPTIIAVDGELRRRQPPLHEARRLRRLGVLQISTFARTYSEGKQRRLTFETAERLGWRLPGRDHRAGRLRCQFVKHRKAAGELIDLGNWWNRGSRLPGSLGAQALGCSPVATAFSAGEDDRRSRSDRRPSRARSRSATRPTVPMSCASPAETGGVVGERHRGGVVDGIELLAASEGIFAETAGGGHRGRAAQSGPGGPMARETRPSSPTSPAALKTATASAARAPALTPVPASLRAVRERYAGLI